MSPPDPAQAGLLPPGASYASITAAIADPVLRQPAGRVWWIVFSVGLVLTLVMLVSIIWLFWQGIGIFGNNTSVVWGFPIASYVWWIGIGNAGTLISCMLLLTRQQWRNSINRFAEAMTLFAAMIAGLFPILHLGRPYLFYWLAPYPNTMGTWPQWRSPLVWDFFAILSYLIFSILFWYVGALPDFATFRDRSRSRAGQLIYGALALGWRGSARHWASYETFYRTMAALGVPLVVSVHSVVGMDFAAGNMPGMQETIYPPYFVVGAMFSGFAMVVVLAAVVRSTLHVEGLITARHFNAMAKILLAGSCLMGLSYATEWFQGWYAGAEADRTVIAFQFTGDYAGLYWMQLLCNVAAPQLLWLPRIRRSIPVLLVVAILINVGMYLERILLIINTLSRGHLPSQWRLFAPTLWDWLLLAGSLGFFVFLFACFLRLAPAISIHEVRKLVPPEEARVSARFLGEFTEPQALVHAARVTRQASTFRVVDAFSPFSVGGLAEEIEPARSSSRIRPALLLGGLAGAVAGALLQWYSAVVALPLIAGGRPLASWPDFFFATFELAILGAALSGFAALLWSCGLPRLHHPLFDVPGFERVTQDRFFLEIEAEADADAPRARQHLHALGASRVQEVPQ